MQPQDSGLDWLHTTITAIGVVAGGILGAFSGVWRAARIEPNMRRDITQEIAEAKHEFKQELDSSTDVFDETLKGLRQKINDVELETAKEFKKYVDRDDFKEFLTEYRSDRADQRADFRDLKENVSRILGERK